MRTRAPGSSTWTLLIRLSCQRLVPRMADRQLLSTDRQSSLRGRSPHPYPRGMIIEAGYDLGQLIHPELFASDESKRGLWMLAMDKHLRLSFLDKVSEEMSVSVEPHIPDIVAALENHYTPLRYFVLAHMMPRLGSGIAEWVYRDDTPLRESPSLGR